jgi:hypothetical protein
MERDDLDRFLYDDIVPSSGFVSCVMDAVRGEAAAPPAIPFPWSRAVPGIVAVLVTFAAAVAGFFFPGRMAIEAPATPVAAASLPHGATVAWLLVVLLLCTVPVLVSLRITRGHW